MMRKLWDDFKPPVVEEGDSDSGTSLFASPINLFRARLIMAILLMVGAFSRFKFWDYRFHAPLPDVLYVFQSVTFFVLAAASFFVANNHDLNLPIKICISGTFVEWMHFMGGVLSIMGAIFNSYYYPALIFMFLHFAMAPKIRVRRWFVALPMSSYVLGCAINEIWNSRIPSRDRMLAYSLDMVGYAVAGVIVLVLADIVKYAEHKQGLQLIHKRNPTSYSAI